MPDERLGHQEFRQEWRNMKNSDSAESSSEQTVKAGKKFGNKTVGGVAVVVLITAYSFVQPVLNERMGWNLPGLRQNSHGQIVTDSKPTNARLETTAAKAKETTAREAKRETAKSGKTAQEKTTATTAKSSKPGASTSKSGPLADRISPSKAAPSKSPRGPPQTPQADEDLLYGLLREVSRDRYISPNGLQYGPGSEEGHRLEHLRRHVKDIPNRPVHGVFDGDLEGALKTIDQAYAKAKQGIKTTKRVDGRRTIYTVDMGKRIGFIGGRDGARKRNPMARRVRLVLEGTQVITAYPDT